MIFSFIFNADSVSWFMFRKSAASRRNENARATPKRFIIAFFLNEVEAARNVDDKLGQGWATNI